MSECTLESIPKERWFMVHRACSEIFRGRTREGNWDLAGFGETIGGRKAPRTSMVA